MKKTDLNGIWRMKECTSGESYEAKVPGSVLSVLTKHHVIEDPFDRMNEYQTRDLFYKDYQFERTFMIEKDTLQQEHVELVCEGLDTLAEIYINGDLVKKTNNMHRTWRIPLKEYLAEGENRITIIFRSTLQFIEDYTYEPNKQVQYVPCGCMKGNHLLRKAHSMFGWDWGPQLPDAGIFKDIYIESWSGCKLEEIQIHQEHQAGEVLLTIGAKLSGVTEKKSKENGYCLKFEVRQEEEKESVQKIVELTDGNKVTAETEVSVELCVKNPKLWWPNEYGDQPLYEVRVTLCKTTEELEEVQQEKKTIGLRTLTVSREADRWGKEFAFMVNGVKIFTMGGNWIPEDCIYSRITRERQDYLLESVKRAHFNCVRVWGGGYYPSDDFYDLCDRKGLIVWQDLMFACNVYDVTEEFADNCRQEVLDNLKRLRHHACLGLICGNNEIESAWHHWGEFQRESLQLRADYIKLFEMVLPEAAKEAAPDIFYWKSSPSSEGSFDDPDNENNGDTHYWNVWHGMLPFTDYKNHCFRFCSEFGFQSFPAKKTVDTFTRKEDQNIFSRTMESHQKNDSANGKMLYYLSENFRYPSDFDSLLYVSQVLQGVAVKYGVDHWRRHRGRCMGALYWQINDNWPAPSWSSIDYFGRWKALHYMACRFYEKMAISITIDENVASLYVENEYQNPQQFQVEILVKNMDCKVLGSVCAKGEIGAFESKKVLAFDLKEIPVFAERMKEAKKCGNLEEEIFVEGVMRLPDGTIKREVETLLPYKYINLQKAKIETKVSEENDAYIIRVQSNVFAPFVELDFLDADVIFSDNYFYLTDREEHAIRLEKKDIIKGRFESGDDLKNRLKVRSLADTY